MRVRRRRLFAGLAGLSTLALVTETNGISRLGVSHAAAIGTADETVASLDLDEANGTLTIDSDLENATVKRVDADEITFDPDPTGEPVPITAAIETNERERIEDTITVCLENKSVQTAVQQRVVLERADDSSH
ncbi:hypothetical protein [Natrarchaeobaculum aegyptiacum]|uniref:Uncharacterized protein n=1 Tax=Natrarchaeobaculum aegyptiacum TaxID=745377 RepID=A0A2Z2HX15_9EURY|nr:hypothetical protein [Natrarchaeobaculum aegyptiacum]ARS91929.1 hypothetical protein B1756_18225 [Natrarchaeobaculum aegyptiacum]